MENADDYPDSAEHHDSSYIVVHEDAPVAVHNPHPVELTQAASWYIGSRSKMNNVAVIQGIRRWIPYDPDSRDPADVGGRVAAAVATYRDKIFIKKPYVTETTLLAYIVDAAFTSSNQTSTFFAKVAVGGNAVVYMEFKRYGEANKKTGHKAGYLEFLGLSDTPP